jgi:hypothetical protein
MVKFVKVLPAPEKVAEVLYLHERGLTPIEITEKLFGVEEAVPGKGGVKAVRGILRDLVTGPDGETHLVWWEPDIDEVAVARALNGDRLVWDALTHYERREVMLAVFARRELEQGQNTADRAGYDEKSWDRKKGWLYVFPNARVPEWLERLCESFELTPKRIIDEARLYAQARVL